MTQANDERAHCEKPPLQHECWSCDHKNTSTAPPDVSKSSVSMEKVVDKVTNSDGRSCGKIFIEITSGPIRVSQLLDGEASCDECGAISTFLGVTRNHFNGKRVTRLEYEAFSSMAMREMEKIALDVFSKYAQIHRVVISHRIGVVPVRESSVFIAVTSEHRQSGLEATAFAINTLKARVPIWKKEFYDETETVSTAADGKTTVDSEGLWKKNAEFVEHPSSPVKRSDGC
jgi:molybdopterin synthase catalytic subunit